MTYLRSHVDAYDYTNTNCEVFVSKLALTSVVVKVEHVILRS